MTENSMTSIADTVTNRRGLLRGLVGLVGAAALGACARTGSAPPPTKLSDVSDLRSGDAKTRQVALEELAMDHGEVANTVYATFPGTQMRAKTGKDGKVILVDKKDPKSAPVMEPYAATALIPIATIYKGESGWVYTPVIEYNSRGEVVRMGPPLPLPTRCAGESGGFPRYMNGVGDVLKGIGMVEIGAGEMMYGLAANAGKLATKVVDNSSTCDVSVKGGGYGGGLDSGAFAGNASGSPTTRCAPEATAAISAPITVRQEYPRREVLPSIPAPISSPRIGKIKSRSYLKAGLRPRLFCLGFRSFTRFFIRGFRRRAHSC